MSESFSADTPSFLSAQQRPTAAVRRIDDYWDTDDILSSDTKILCRFEMPVYRLGFLAAGSSDEHIAVGVKMELPQWMARVLCSRRRQIVSVELPKAYKDAYRDVIRADASVINLHKLGPYYYGSGIKMLEFNFSENEAIAKALLTAFLNRFRKIMDLSQNSLKADSSELMVKMDESEKKLFKLGRGGVTAFDMWITGRCFQLQTSSITRNMRKRKHPSDDNETD